MIKLLKLIFHFILCVLAVFAGVTAMYLTSMMLVGILAIFLPSYSLLANILLIGCIVLGYHIGLGVFNKIKEDIKT